MSFTLRLEIINSEAPWNGWHCPEHIEGFTAHPRTKETASIAAAKLSKFANQNKHFIKEWRIKIYSGRVHFYHKDRLEQNYIGVVEQ